MTYYRRAANRSVQLYAYDSALEYTDRILALLQKLPSTADRIKQQIDAWFNRADILIVTEGWTYAERRHALEQARRLAEQADADVQLFHILMSLHGYYENAGMQQANYQVCEEGIALAERLQDQALLSRAYCSMGDCHIQGGAYLASLDCFRKAERSREGLWLGRRAYCMIVETLWACGYPDQASAMANEILRTVDAQTDPFDQIHAREFSSYVYQRMGDLEAMMRTRSEMVELSARYGFPDYVLVSQFMLGWAMAMTREEAGLYQMYTALNDLGSDDMFSLPYFLTLYAEAQGKFGQVEQALDTLARAEDVIAQTEIHAWDAEVLRLTGDLRLQLGRADSDAESCYRLAMDISRQQGARSLELRAATSMARLWQRQGRHREAHALLSEIYDWFTEGFDTPTCRPPALCWLNSTPISPDLPSNPSLHDP
ncbi:MAG: hypothetical protein HC802_14835 [Caldilineaceae bacterium]|nr:hypothetical protein [Caldilineaceae bacterium]